MSAGYKAMEVKEALEPRIENGYKAQNRLEYNPLGVCAVITPWNYPLSMAHCLIIPALRV